LDYQIRDDGGGLKRERERGVSEYLKRRNYFGKREAVEKNAGCSRDHSKYSHLRETTHDETGPRRIKLIDIL
jgi:hypothetical protein